MKKSNVILLVIVSLFSLRIKGQNFQEVTQSTPFSGLMIGSIAFSDIDGDNDQDLLLTGYDNTPIPNLKLYLNDGNGNYSEIFESPLNGVIHGDVIFLDVNGDGSKDVLITGDSLPGPVGGIPSSVLYLNNGCGFFEKSSSIFDDVEYSSVAYADIDGDNDQDILITGNNSLNQRIAKLYSNDGLGNYTLVTGTPFVGVRDGDVAFADIDGDNDQDVLITGLSATGISSKLYVNDGIGNFSFLASSIESVSFSSISFADIDNDNDQDLLITGRNQLGVPISRLYKNDGIGNYSIVTAPFDDVEHSSVTFADIDGDSDQDLLITGKNAINQAVSNMYINNGTGTFNYSPSIIITGINEGVVKFSDINNDNDQDLLIIGSTTISFPYQLVTKLYRNNDTTITNYGNNYYKKDTICNGDSILIFGNYQKLPGIYRDTIPSAIGCDTIHSMYLTLNPSYILNQNQEICQGDSILIYGSYQYTSGVYYDSLQTINGCDSVLSTILTVNPLPNVTLSNFNPDTICSSSSTVALPNGSPSGGVYSGSGVSGGTFDPNTAGLGTHSVIYTYTDANSCINSDSTFITVEQCVGMDDLENDLGILIYPNPNIGLFTIEKSSELDKEVKVSLLDATSRVIIDKLIPKGQQKIEMDITSYSKGVYYLQLTVGKEVFVKQILKN